MASTSSTPATVWYAFVAVVGFILFFDSIAKLLLGALLTVGILLVLNYLLKPVVTDVPSSAPPPKPPQQSQPKE